MSAMVIAVAAVWMAALLIGVISWEKSKKRRLRRTDIAVFAVSVAAGLAWMFLIVPRDSAAAAEAGEARRPIATCAVIAPGDSEATVREKLGEPDEIRGEEELRGPASNVWIYRDSRCALHFFGDRVESIE